MFRSVVRNFGLWRQGTEGRELGSKQEELCCEWGDCGGE
jgi:hypothetical protein